MSCIKFWLEGKCKTKATWWASWELSIENCQWSSQLNIIDCQIFLVLCNCPIQYWFRNDNGQRLWNITNNSLHVVNSPTHFEFRQPCVSQYQSARYWLKHYRCSEDSMDMKLRCSQSTGRSVHWWLSPEMQSGSLGCYAPLVLNPKVEERFNWIISIFFHWVMQFLFIFYFVTFKASSVAKSLFVGDDNV